MDVQLETPGGLVRQMRVRIPAERVSQAMEQRLKQIAGRARIPGFRPGKAPLKVVRSQYGEQARMDVISDLVRGTYPEALQQAGVNPAGPPDFQVTMEKAGEPLEYVARFEVYPEIQLKGLDALAIERPKVEVTDEDVDKLIANLRRSRRTLQTVERPAQQGDVCTLDFEGRIDDEPFQGGKGEQVQVEIGSGQFLPDLENALVGHGAGDSFEADVLFPDDYRNEGLRSKTARFSVTVHEVREAHLPEIDAEFLKLHGADESAGEQGLRDKCRAALQMEVAKAVRGRVKAQVMEQLLVHNPVDVPQALVAQEITRVREDAAGRLNIRHLKPEEKLKMLPDEMLAPQAQRRIALGLLISEYVRQDKIEADPARVEQALDEMARDYDQPDQLKEYYRSQPELLGGLRGLVLEDQAVERLTGSASITDKPMTLDELLGARN
jgi:trigger factor